MPAPATLLALIAASAATLWAIVAVICGARAQEADDPGGDVARVPPQLRKPAGGADDAYLAAMCREAMRGEGERVHVGETNRA